MTNKKIVYFDMDGVLVDLAQKINSFPPEVVKQFEALDMIEQLPAIFLDPDPIAGAVDAFNKICESDKYEGYILSTAPWNAPWVWTQKREWVETVSYTHLTLPTN